MKETVHTHQNAAGRRSIADGGQGLLEFALVLPLLILLGVGVVELGRAACYTIRVNNAATAGVEYGAQTSLTAQDISGMQNSAILDSNFSPMTATATYGCACDDGSGISCTYPVPAPSTCSPGYLSCGDGKQLVECVQVTTQSTFHSLFNYPGLPATYQANGRAVMRVRK